MPATGTVKTGKKGTQRLCQPNRAKIKWHHFTGFWYYYTDNRYPDE